MTLKQRVIVIVLFSSAMESFILKFIEEIVGNRFFKKSSTPFHRWKAMMVTFRQFAFNNVIRYNRVYAAYFLSSMFTVMVFFTFAMFAFHPALYEETMKDKALYGMAVAGGIIVIFSFFFILYSMSSFLQSRKKEFGVLMVQG